MFYASLFNILDHKICKKVFNMIFITPNDIGQYSERGMDQEVIFVLCILYNNIFIALTFALHYADKCAVVFVTITNARKSRLHPSLWAMNRVPKASLREKNKSDELMCKFANVQIWNWYRQFANFNVQGLGGMRNVQNVLRPQNA